MTERIVIQPSRGVRGLGWFVLGVGVLLLFLGCVLPWWYGPTSNRLAGSIFGVVVGGPFVLFGVGLMSQVAELTVDQLRYRGRNFPWPTRRWRTIERQSIVGVRVGVSRARGLVSAIVTFTYPQLQIEGRKRGVILWAGAGQGIRRGREYGEANARQISAWATR